MLEMLVVRNVSCFIRRGDRTDDLSSLPSSFIHPTQLLTPNSTKLKSSNLKSPKKKSGKKVINIHTRTHLGKALSGTGLNSEENGNPGLPRTSVFFFFFFFFLHQKLRHHERLRSLLWSEDFLHTNTRSPITSTESETETPSADSTTVRTSSEFEAIEVKQTLGTTKRSSNSECLSFTVRWVSFFLSTSRAVHSSYSLSLSVYISLSVSVCERESSREKIEEWWWLNATQRVRKVMVWTCGVKRWRFAWSGPTR